MAKAKQELVLGGDDLTAARNVVDYVFLNRAYCALSGDFEGELDILIDAMPVARLYGALGCRSSSRDAVLTGKQLKRLRRAVKEMREWVEFHMSDWHLVGAEEWETDGRRRSREWTLALLADVERVEAVLA